jgi:ankyrin repeat protein
VSSGIFDHFGKLPQGGDAMFPVRDLFLLLVACCFSLMNVASSANDLTDALKARNLAKVRRLVAAGANVNEVVRRDYPLNIAATFGPAKSVSILLESGANPNQPGRDGRYPLHNAVVMSHTDIVALLLKAGASVDAKDRMGRTPLNHFAASGGSDIEIAKALMAAGANPDNEDMDHWTALNYVARYTGNAELAKVLITAGADINHPKDNGETPVGSATFHGHHDLARFLIAAGADVNKPLKDGTSPLAQTTDPAMRQLLIEAGAK